MSKRRRRKAKITEAVYGRGAFTGYADYRYGTTKKNSHTRIFIGEARESIVNKVIAEMHDWRLSPFENEGDMTHALRSGLCLEGHGFSRSDREASELVQVALDRLGAVRPTWEQGQPEYTEPRDSCVWCGKKTDLVSSDKAYRFCSEMCARAAIEKHNFERRNETDRVYSAARRIVMKTRTKPRLCKWCGASFQPIREASKQETCSYFCSGKHKAASRSHLSFDRDCSFCGVHFVGRSPTARFCSKTCSHIQTRLANGRIPHALNARVFDHFFTVPINANVLAIGEH